METQTYNYICFFFYKNPATKGECNYSLQHANKNKKQYTQRHKSIFFGIFVFCSSTSLWPFTSCIFQADFFLSLFEFIWFFFFFFIHLIIIFPVLAFITCLKPTHTVRDAHAYALEPHSIVLPPLFVFVFVFIFVFVYVLL